MELSVIIPAYGEAQVIPQTVEAVQAYWSSAGNDFEVVVVDDGSPDGTANVVEEMHLGRVRVCRQQHRGKGATVRAGISASRGEFVYFVDADLPYAVEDQAKVLGKVQAGALVAVGSRRASGASADAYPLFRRAGSWALSMMVRQALRIDTSDTQCGLKAFRGDLAREIFPLLTIDGFAFDLELLVLLADAGIEVEECPVTLRHDKASSVNVVSDSLAMLSDVRRIRRRRRHLADPAPASYLAAGHGRAAEGSVRRGER